MTGKVSKRQEIVFEELKQAGFEVQVFRSKEEIDDFIRGALS